MGNGKLSSLQKSEVNRVKAIVSCHIEMLELVAHELIERSAPLDRRLSSADFISLALQNIVAYAEKRKGSNDPLELVNSIIFDRVIH